MIPKYLVAVALLICTAGSVSAQSVKAGIDAWQRSDYSAAVAIWRPLAEKGDADAEFNLGQAYRLGRGVPTNLAAAKTWFERAGSQGHVDAQTTLGLLLFQSGDQTEGLKWLKQAAEQGEPRALLVYGTALVNGDGVTQDPIRGYAYVSRAAAQGLEPAKQTLAQLDKLMPLEDRKKAIVVARAKAKAAPPPSSAPEKPATKPDQVAKAKPAPKPIESAPAKPEKPVIKQAVAEAATPAKGDWRIQLGAFSQKGSAESLYAKLSGKSVLAGRRAYYVPVGSITRLQVGPFESKAAAASACKALGQACFAVAAK
jgi:uncharacterized protein